MWEWELLGLRETATRLEHIPWGGRISFEPHLLHMLYRLSSLNIFPKPLAASSSTLLGLLERKMQSSHDNGPSDINYTPYMYIASKSVRRNGWPNCRYLYVFSLLGRCGIFETCNLRKPCRANPREWRVSCLVSICYYIEPETERQRETGKEKKNRVYHRIIV